MKGSPNATVGILLLASFAIANTGFERIVKRASTVTGKPAVATEKAACDKGNYIWMPSEKPFEDILVARKRPHNDDGNALGDIVSLIAGMNKDGLKTIMADILPKDFTLSRCATNQTNGAEVAIGLKNFQGNEKQLITLQDKDLVGMSDPHPIWPIIIVKIVQKIIQIDSHVPGGLPPQLKGENGKNFECNKARTPLCKLSDLVSRVMGIPLQSTRRIMEDTTQVPLDKIFQNASQHGPVFIFERNMPSYIVENVTVPDTFQGIRLKVSKPENVAVWDFRMEGWENFDQLAFSEIKGDHRKDTDRDIHVVHPL